MTTTLAIANQKGGVAKTTSVASIGAALVELGHKVLLVDLDPQACLTFSLGIDPEDLEISVHHVLTKGPDPTEAIIETEDGVDLLPATIELAGAEADLLTRTGREHVIKSAIEALAEDDVDYDWVLLDCPPSLGVLTVAALTAADGVLIPLQCETLSHRGVGQLLDTVHDVRRFTNRKLEVWGCCRRCTTAGPTTPAPSSRRSATPTTSRSSSRRSPRRSSSPRRLPPVVRSSATSRSSKGARAYREVAANLVKRSLRPKA
ncbi:ParA family protein [Nocardioides sp. B-3]|uniref:ParA family protein n=1 Tax=Nocardioides sp. B-3 TaxID=2895565 RepID=UPI0021538501|nr:AAA family ATPase [Nocardioides sp. B-3]UUZ58159.1 AAA family ATPase [Nocardioides sp. B-3]